MMKNHIHIHLKQIVSVIMQLSTKIQKKIAVIKRMMK